MIERYRRRLLFLVVTLAVASGCGRQQEGENRPTTYYQLKGQVVALEAPSGLITIAHERIPGFMEAMTMPFIIKDSTLFRGVEIGDSVRGVVARQKPEMWLDSLVVVWKWSTSEASK